LGRRWRREIPCRSALRQSSDCVFVRLTSSTSIHNSCTNLVGNTAVNAWKTLPAHASAGFNPQLARSSQTSIRQATPSLPSFSVKILRSTSRTQSHGVRRRCPISINTDVITTIPLTCSAKLDDLETMIRESPEIQKIGLRSPRSPRRTCGPHRLPKSFENFNTPIVTFGRSSSVSAFRTRHRDYHENVSENQPLATGPASCGPTGPAVATLYRN